MSPPRVLVTAGPTHEPIDAVRYIGNRSSGRMGLALAEAAAARGWPTTLLLGPTSLLPSTSSQFDIVRFQTTADLQRLLAKLWPEHDVLLMAAAVADYRPAVSLSPRERAGVRVADSSQGSKIKRDSHPLTIQLEPTPDLLVELAVTTRPDQVMVGFALEPADRLLASARDKLRRKRLDAIVANPLETMDAATITATLLLADGHEVAAPPNLPKRDFALWLLEHLAELMTRRGQTAASSAESGAHQ